MNHQAVTKKSNKIFSSVRKSRKRSYAFIEEDSDDDQVYCSLYPYKTPTKKRRFNSNYFNTPPENYYNQITPEHKQKEYEISFERAHERYMFRKRCEQRQREERIKAARKKVLKQISITKYFKVKGICSSKKKYIQPQITWYFPVVGIYLSNKYINRRKFITDYFPVTRIIQYQYEY